MFEKSMIDDVVQKGDPLATYIPIHDEYDEVTDGKRNCKTSRLTNMPFYEDLKPANLTLVREEENWNPRSIAIDYIGNKLYVVVANEMTVNIYDLNGHNKAIVFRNESVIPIEVVLDVPQGLMFVLGYNNKIGAMQIYRANMDGTSVQLILENIDELEEIQIRERIGFAISTLKKRIYFPNFKDSILESSDYEGQKRVTIGKVKHPSSVTAYNDTVYWSEGSSVIKGFACFKPDGCSIWTCQIDDTGSCIDNSTKLFEKGANQQASHSIKAVVTNPRIGSNPCEVDNGGCEHHCLLRHSSIEGSLGSSCVCKEGYRLSEDLKNCTKTKIANIYDSFYLPKRMKLTELSNLSSTDVFPISRNLLYRLKFERSDRVLIKSPFTYLEIEENGKSILENEIAQRDSATSDVKQDSQLYTFGLNVETHQCKKNVGDVVVTRSPNGFARVLSYDWVTKNLYYVKLPSSSGEQSELAALRLELPKGICLDQQKPIFHYRSKRAVNLAKIPEPVSLVVHPYRGYVIASLRNGSLIRLNTDGSDKIILPNVSDSVLLATDMNDDKIYWMSSDQYLNFANLDGSSSKRLFKSPVKEIKAMEIYDSWIYITDEKKLWRFDKLTGKASGIIEDFQDIQQLYRESLGLKVPSKYAHYVSEDHPCAVGNGHCESLCFEVQVERGSGDLRKVCA
ncbi:low-density lipoprotein receptor-related protein 5-like [Nasonia vitripennis]|uniref:Vitellogenin receptor n=1 Tax=Nasonia vitripennis TaxID=7425 RepID=A0A7M7TAN8_NASVI|nr:low-density lipoprotein receptor-related protein 5-like [Nasonia vitripennis]XP_031787418.1 low-density lipoprotein receptor-related protein 5-like [Nasonia vitripennis]